MKEGRRSRCAEHRLGSGHILTGSTRRDGSHCADASSRLISFPRRLAASQTEPSACSCLPQNNIRPHPATLRRTFTRGLRLGRARGLCGRTDDSCCDLLPSRSSRALSPFAFRPVVLRADPFAFASPYSSSSSSAPPENLFGKGSASSHTVMIRSFSPTARYQWPSNIKVRPAFRKYFHIKPMAA